MAGAALAPPLVIGVGVAALLTAGVHLFRLEFGGGDAANRAQAASVEPSAPAGATDVEAARPLRASETAGTVRAGVSAPKGSARLSPIPPVASGDPAAVPSVRTSAPPQPASTSRGQNPTQSVRRSTSQPVREQPKGAPTRPSPAAAAEPVDDPPSDRGVIGGRVLDESGRPLPGVELTASATRLFEPDRESTRATAQEVHYAVTDFAGVYQFWDLAEGEYRIQSTAMGPFGSEQQTVRTGVLSADLVLNRHQDVTVFGVVRGRHGEPLDGVQVTGFGSPPRITHTDLQGQYELTLSLKANRPDHVLHFKRTGYREQRLRLDVGGADAGFEDVQLDATLEPVAALAAIRGSIRDSAGNPVARQAVSLSSRSAQRGYQAVSDKGGRFSFPGVEPAADYQVFVAAKGAHRDYKRKDLVVEAGGLILDIALEPAPTARLEGQMVDSEGHPIPGFSLTLKSRTTLRRSVQVVGDQRGRFTVDEVPEGVVELRTESSPRLFVSGLRVSRDLEEPVTVVLDLGRHELRGWVLDDRGDPVPTASMNVRMEHIENGIRSFSAREAISDADGYFEFFGLGPGIHTVRAVAEGFVTIEFDTDVGTDDAELMIELEKE